MAWNIYRAVVLAITVPEAVGYNHYASQPLMVFFTAAYHPANQVLHTLFCWLIFRLFRVSEWSFRLPGLLGLAFYFWASAKLCRSASKTAAQALIATLICLINPFTVGWLPVASGVWISAGLLLTATGLMLQYLHQDKAEREDLGLASLLLGLATGFDISFAIPSVAVVLVFLHLNFWGRRSVSLARGVDCLVLPMLLTSFTLWALPFLNARTPFRFELSCVALLPAIIALSVPQLAVRSGKLAVGTGILGFCGALLVFRLGIGYLPDRFQQGPERTMPKVARALRDDIRRSPTVRSFEVRASSTLIEPVNFYRRRYALGAVPVITSATSADTTDYLILLPADTQLANHPASTRIFSAGQISLFIRPPR